MTGTLLALSLAIAFGGGAVVVAPPEGPAGAPAGWIGAAVAEALPRALQRAGVPAIPDADRRRALETLGASAAGTTHATAIRVAEALGASRLVLGSWEQRGADLTLSLRLLDVSRGSLSAPLVATAPLGGLGGLVGALAWDIALAGPRPPAGTRDALVQAAGRAPLEAVRALGEGLAVREAPLRQAGARRALAVDPAYEEAALALGRMLVDASAFEEARAVLSRVAPGSVFARDARFLDGVALLGLGRHREADVLYSDLARDGASAAVLSNRALARLRAGAAAGGASTLLRQAVEAEPASLDLPFNLGRALLVEGDAAAATFWLRGALRHDPVDAQGRLLLSWALAAGGQADEAEEQRKAAVALLPSLGTLHTPDASSRLERVLLSEWGLLLDPERAADAAEARSLASRGETLLGQGNLAGAVSELARASILDPYAAAPHRLLARAHRSLGASEKAVEELRMSLWCREDPVVRRELAELLRALGRADEAKRVLG